MAALEAGRKKRAEKIARRAEIEKKVQEGQPITDEERELLYYKGGKISKEQQKHKVLEAAAALVIKPQSVHQLRLVVEQTAARHGYNPIEELIKLTKDESGLEPKEKAMIHKALLPFLAPQLATPKPEKTAEENAGVKVVLKNFVMQPKGLNPLHEEKPATVETTDANQ